MTEDEEIDELEEDDRDKFNDQLCSIGSLGRLVPDHTVPLLAKWVYAKDWLVYSFSLSCHFCISQCLVN